MRCDRVYQFGLTSTLALLGWIVGESALAQITPDETLGDERSVVVQGGDRIEGGAERGANLFHSFREFNVGEGQRVYFGNPDGIANIFSRVTGGNPSNILGTLGVDGAANLFFLNPNGILFGPNASLDVRGSFVATTANGIQFGEQGFFSATNPEVPSQLLTVNPSAFFFNQLSAASIENQSRAPAGRDPSNSFDVFGLRVPDGQSLLLLGGDVNINSGGIVAFGGHVELAGIAGAGTVGLSSTNSGFDLNIPEGVSGANVSLTDQAGIIVRAGGGGSIEVTAQNVTLSQSSLQAGILGGLGSINAQAGDITVNAQDTLTIENESTVGNNVNSNAVGNSGNVNIEAGSVVISNGGGFSAGMFGQGNSGRINLIARDSVSVESGENFSYISSNVGRDSVGNSGGINISTGSLNLINGAQIYAITRGQGDAGRVTITVRDNITIEGRDQSGNVSGVFSQVRSTLPGNSGGIDITTDSVFLRNGGRIDASTYGQGDGGRINITAEGRIVLDGSDSNSFIFSNVASGSKGNTGGINITTGSLIINSASQIQANVAGDGNTGQIRIFATDEIVVDGRDQERYPSAIFTQVEEGGEGNTGGMAITTGSLRITNRAQLLSNTKGVGDPGDIIIDAQDQVFLDNSIIISEVTEGLGVGNGADITISTGTLELRNASALLADTENRGNAGNITVTARDAVILVGTGPSADDINYIIPSQITSTVDQTEISGGVGEAGTITITAESLSVADNGFISSDTENQGSAGDIIIHVRDNILLDGDITTAVDPVAIGEGGAITITSGSLSLADDGLVSSSTSGQGSAGNIIINVRDHISLDAGDIRSRAQANAVGNGGNIEITSGSLSASNAAQVAASTAGRGNAGNVRIRARDRVAFDGADADGQFFSGIFSNVIRSGVGSGGDIEITARSFSLSNGAQLVANTRGQGNAGNVIIDANDIQLATDSSIFTNVTSTGIGDAGTTRITANTLSLSGESRLLSSTFGQGNAGDIFIDTDRIQLLNGSAITSAVEAGGVGNGGDIQIQSRSISLRGGSRISALVERQQQTEGNVIPGGQGRGGDLRINASDSIALFGVNNDGFASGFFALTERGASGRAGNIYITTGDLRIANGAIVVASTYNPSPGGDIFITANDLEARSGGQIVTSTRNSGNAGLIRLDIADRIVLSGYDPNFADRERRVREYIPTTNGQFEYVSDIINNEGANSGIFANTISGSTGAGGTITVEANSLNLRNWAEISAATSGSGEGGNIEIETDSLAMNDRSRITASTAGSRPAGSITITATDLDLADASSILAESTGKGEAGDITVNVDESLNITDSEIRTSAAQSSGGTITVNAADAAVQLSGTSDITTSVDTGAGDGGSIAITADTIQLHDDSDIRTSVAGGQGDGGNITLRASSIVAFDDSDIIASTPEGQGGDITFATDAFFAEDFDPDAANANPSDLEGNDRPDVNATGTEPGTITTPDTSLIQNSLTDLPESAIDSDALLANSCVVRSQEQQGRFVIVGAEGLPQRPGDVPFPTYPTGSVRSVSPDDSELNDHSWQMGDPIVEPQNAYLLEDGQVILSRECL